MAFERLIDPQRAVELEIGELETLDEVEAEVSALAVDAIAPLVLGIRLKSPPPFSVPEAVQALLHAATASGGAEAVRRALQRILGLADTLNLRTLALPALGTGTGGLPHDACVARMNEALVAASKARPTGALSTVEIVLHDAPTADTFAIALGSV